MTILDAHLHLPYWGTDIDDKSRILLAKLDEHSIDYGIVIADSLGESTIGTSEEIVRLAGKEKRLFAVIGVSPLAGINLHYVANTLDQKRAVGVKLYPGHEPFTLEDSRLIPLYEELEKRRVPLLVHTEWTKDGKAVPHPSEVARVARKFPDLPVVVCHCWKGNALEAVATVAGLHNVYYELSSMLEGDAREAESLLSTLMQKAPSRVLFGSDYASCELDGQLEKLSKMVRGDARTKVLFENANKLYRLNV